MIRHLIVITGATKGLGRTMALKFASAGHRVLGLYSRDEEAAQALRNALKGIGGESLVERLDIRGDMGGFWDRTEIQEAKSLVLINNAWAPFSPRPFHLIDWKDVADGLEVGLKGAWLCSRSVVRPMLRAGRGTVVNVLTDALHDLPPKGMAAYVTAKYAVRGLTQALACEYSTRGIRIFSVSPGFMHSSLNANWDPRLVEAILARIPASDPVKVAGRICELVEGAEVRGCGEDYPV